MDYPRSFVVWLRGVGGIVAGVVDGIIPAGCDGLPRVVSRWSGPSGGQRVLPSGARWTGGRSRVPTEPVGPGGESPWVLWRLVYLVPVVAGCDCFWLFWLTSGTQEASCSEGARMPIAECGRMVPAQWTYSAVATTGGVNVFPRALVTDQLGLVQGVQSLGQGKAKRSRPSTPPRRSPRTRTGQPRGGWTCTARRGRK